MNYSAHSNYLSAARIEELYERGAKARQECRSRSPSPLSFMKIEMKAYQRGWDNEDVMIERCMRP
jgi:hypothetical protein